MILKNEKKNLIPTLCNKEKRVKKKSWVQDAHTGEPNSMIRYNFCKEETNQKS